MGHDLNDPQYPNIFVSGNRHLRIFMDETGASWRGSLIQSVGSTGLFPSVGTAKDRLDNPRRAVGRVKIIVTVVPAVGK